VQYGLTSGNLNNLTTLNSNLNIDHAVVLSGLTVSTKYFFKVISKDNVGNTNSDNSTSNYFITLQSPEFQHNRLSSITNIATGLITDTNAVIAFDTDQGAICNINYGTTSNHYTETDSAENDYNKNHSFNITGLNALTEYFYKINCSASRTYSAFSDFAR
jgi:phosphodiesterase/alkaline phosphatase D-like protein